MKARFSLKPPERLKKRSQFRKAYKQGRPFKSSNFKLILLKNGLTHSRIGLSIEKRRIALASKRTRVKRLLREIFRLNKPFLKKGFDIVIIAGPGAKGLDFEKTRDEVIGLFNKAGLVK